MLPMWQSCLNLIIEALEQGVKYVKGVDVFIVNFKDI